MYSSLQEILLGYANSGSLYHAGKQLDQALLVCKEQKDLSQVETYIFEFVFCLFVAVRIDYFFIMVNTNQTGRIKDSKPDSQISGFISF